MMAFGFLFLFIAVILASPAPLERNKDVIESKQPIKELFDQMHSSASNIDDENIENPVQITTVLGKESEEEYDDHDDVSVYERLEKEDEAIFTDIEKLYTAFTHSDHLHQVPLLSIFGQEPHSITIMVQPEQIQPDTMVRHFSSSKELLMCALIRFVCNMSVCPHTASHTLPT